MRPTKTNGEVQQKAKESMDELHQQLLSLREKHDSIAASNNELRTQNETFEKDLIDLQNKHQNTLGQWNSAKEQLDVERSRIVDAFQSLKTATSFLRRYQCCSRCQACNRAVTVEFFKQQ